MLSSVGAAGDTAVYGNQGGLPNPRRDGSRRLSATGRSKFSASICTSWGGNPEGCGRVFRCPARWFLTRNHSHQRPHAHQCHLYRCRVVSKPQRVSVMVGGALMVVGCLGIWGMPPYIQRDRGRAGGLGCPFSLAIFALVRGVVILSWTSLACAVRERRHDDRDIHRAPSVHGRHRSVARSASECRRP